MEERELTRIEHLIDLKRPADAESGARAYLAAHPDSGRALRALAMALHHQSRDVEALDAARAAVTADPEEVMNHVVVADLHQAMGAYEAAAVSAETAVTLAPDLWLGHYARANALRLGSRNDRARSVADARRAVALAPHSAQARNLLGLCFGAAGRREEERRAYEEALRLDPHLVVAMNNLAALDIRAGRLSSSRRLLTTGLATDPQHEMLRRNYDFLLLRVLQRFWWLLLGIGTVELVLVLGGVAPLARTIVALVLAALGVAVVRREADGWPAGPVVWRGLFRRQSGRGRMVLIQWAVTTSCMVATAVLPQPAAATAFIAGVVVLELFALVSLLVVGLGRLVRAVRDGAGAASRRRVS